MAATIYKLDETPVLAENLESGDTVTVAIYNKATGAAVSLSASSATEIGTTGIYRYTVAMTTPPEYGKNTYIYIFTGTLQKRYGEFNWIDDESVFTDDSVHLDFTGGGVSGTQWPKGGYFQPVDNFADARTIANRYGITKYIIKGNGTLPSGTAHTNWTFSAVPKNPLISTLTLNNCNVAGSHFEYFTLTGQQNGAICSEHCRLTALTDYEGCYQCVGLAGNITQKSGGEATFVDVVPEVAVLPNIDVNGVSGTNMSNIQGAISLVNMTGGVVNFSFTGFILVQASCTGGTLRIGGVGYWVDLGSGLTVQADATIPAAIWDRALSSHEDAGSFGYAMNQIGTAVAIDGGAAKLGAMLAKLADDNGGASYDATTDSQKAIAGRLPASLVSGRIDANIGSISDDVTAADNLEATYDGTGYEDPYAPAQQQQLDQIALTGAAINTPASGATITTGTSVSGSYTDTAALDGIHWQIADAAGVLDMYYEFTLSSDAVPVSIAITGRVNSSNDTLKVFAYNWAGAVWQQIGTLPGKNQSTDDSSTYTLYTSHVGTGANLGKVRVRFQNTGLTTANFYTDQIFLSYAVVSRSVGYADGAIWVDDVHGTTGKTVPFINGTADNPVATWADALTLSGLIGIHRFRITGGTAITLTGNSDHYQIIGAEYALDLNGQSIMEAYIEGATISGTSTGNNARFIDCKIGTCSLTQCGFGRCALQSTVTLLSAGTYIWEGCFSSVAGTDTPRVDFGAAVGDTNLNMRHYSGGIEVKNMGQSGNDRMSIEGDGQIIIASDCTGGLIAIRGNIRLTDNSGGAVTLSQDARVTQSTIADALTSLEMNFSYDAITDTLKGQMWLEREKEVIADPGSISVVFKDESRATLWTEVDSSPVGGVFTITKISPTGIVRNKLFSAEATVTLPDSSTVKGNMGINTVG